MTSANETEVKQAQRENALQPMAWVIDQLETRPDVLREVDVVGRWLWISFAEKPDQETREFLRSIGFRWNGRRMAWQHCCGWPTKRANHNPRWMFGSVPLSQVLDEEKAITA